MEKHMKKIFTLIIIGTILLFVGKTFADESKPSLPHAVKYIVNEMHDAYFHVSNFIIGEIVETKEYQKIKWTESQEQMVNLNTKAKIQLKGFFNKFPESN
jgi:hypothetical protein